MARIKFTRHLFRYFPDLQNDTEIEGTSEIIDNLDTQYPGLAAYIMDEHGILRKHVNIFIGEDLIHDRKDLSDPIQETDQVYIFQALSGG